jgi:hypothetical protein
MMFPNALQRRADQVVDHGRSFDISETRIGEARAGGVRVTKENIINKHVPRQMGLIQRKQLASSW